MKLWELKEKLNALPPHDDDLDVMICSIEAGEFMPLGGVSRWPRDWTDKDTFIGLSK